MEKSQKTLYASLLIMIVVVIGLVVLTSQSKSPITLPIEVREYSDFQCPACAGYAPTVSELKTDKYKGLVEFEYKHFPLVSIHDRAYSAAIAAEAAREQGMFNEYHDILFANQGIFSDEDYLGYATELDMNTDQFIEDYSNNPEVKQRVEDDLQESLDLGLNSTPTFFINGKKISGISPTGILDLVDKYISKAE